MAIQIRLIRDQNGKARCYGFIEFEREKDMLAYKDTDGLKILGRRIIVDVERARTVKGWKPRRLGGRLGGRETKASQSSNNSFRDRGNQGRGYKAEAQEAIEIGEIDNAEEIDQEIAPKEADIRL
ncbi:hypothetical protein G6F46_010536 [Rhizopus delemar]|uniref:RRM domain-containing protein n=1 Tax=Rhizopus oryzae TaxID=64495 RepID=A0A9P7C6Y2_RHIOR|nr:hypothetical protein G6F54_010988 [Rhizopus delemar]KAG1538670.1 hypothetical protein G6F51_009624 [Rhizopus arrhizus]KAG1505014.1 hypothetical protein G6F53_010272 [Rhizopus delemar]KAG1516801.1 hypothetical protein G6F52_009367 [Rhizopus delemar]KAG1584633.1 hypothetical protein G6F47_011684 [Rhizopus delemar]